MVHRFQSSPKSRLQSRHRSKTRELSNIYQLSRSEPVEDSSQPDRDRVRDMGRGGGGKGEGGRREGIRANEQLQGNYMCLTACNGCFWDVYTCTVDTDDGSAVYV